MCPKIGNGDNSLTQHDKPLGLLDTVVISLGISQTGDIDLVGGVDLVLGSVSDENGLATPLDDDLESVSAVPNTKKHALRYDGPSL